MRDACQMQVKSVVDEPGGSRGKPSEDRELVGTGVRFMRHSSDASRLGKISMGAEDRGYLLGVSLRAGHVRHIYQQHHFIVCEFVENSFYLRNLADRYLADFTGAFDFLLLEMSPLFLKRLAEEEGGQNVVDLRCSAGEMDLALSHMLRAVAPALDGSFDASTLFLDQLAIAIGMRLIERHSSAPRPAPKPLKALLSPSQLGRAKELLRSRLDKSVSITDVARDCGFSRGYFIRAFRQTTGHTPHRWLLGQRVDAARTLLAQSDLSLADVAIACGFSDQSHFTRIFSGITGTTPGSFRRASRV